MSSPTGQNAPSKLEDGPSGLPKSQAIPRWVPVSLLALTTAALAVPLVLLRRHKGSTLARALENAPPPPRRAGGGAPPLSRAAPTPVKPVAFPNPTAEAPKALNSRRKVDDFNYALYCAKAFGYATMIVTAGGAATVWGVKQYMGVKDTAEFAERMRVWVLVHLPQLSSRIHRPPIEEDHTATILNDPVTVTEVPQIEVSGDDWVWPDAEKRLGAAYDQDGFSGWAKAALEELEAEGRIERRKRGHE